MFDRRRYDGDTAERVHDLVAPLLDAEGLELVDVQFTGGALQVFVDRPGGVDLEALSDVSMKVSRLLDDHDPVSGRYTLEVSSPGLERPLRTPDHFQRVIGAMVTVRTHPGTEGERRETGILQDADHEGIVINDRRLGYGDIERARTVFEWGSPAPSKTKKKKKGASR